MTHPAPPPTTPPRAGLSRRRFLQGVGATAAGVMLSNLNGSVFDAAAAQTGPRTLVCIFLAGGADSFNMYVPRDHSVADQTHDTYRTVRGSFAVPAASLLPIGDGSFGFHPRMTNLAGLHNSGNVAVVRNVGPLIRPTTKSDYQAKRSLPQDLFSHDTQQKLWQTARPTTAGDQGWGDAIAAAVDTGSTLAPAFSINGSNRWQAGRNSDYTKLSAGSRISPLLGYDASLRRWIPTFAGVESVLRESLTAASGSEQPFLNVAADVVKRSIVATEELESALVDGADAVDMSDVGSSKLGAQLRRVAILIKNRQMLGMERQVFFVRLGGWDTHHAQQEHLDVLLANLDASLGSFHRAIDDLGLADSVTTFTASDFGRTLTINGTGTDHGWGGHAFVAGGAVRAGDYGTFPSYAVANNPDDTGDRSGKFAGRLIPTTSVSQYGATLGGWMGMSSAQLSSAFPELSNFATTDLGFMNS